MELSVTLSEYYQGKLTVDFANKVDLDDAYINLRYFPTMEIRIGQFGYPFGAEGMTSSKVDPFAESSAIGSAVSSGRDRGFMLHGNTKNDQYAYQFAIMNGVPQNTPDNNEDLDVAVRLVRNPEEVVEEEWNRWYGISYSQGKQLVGKDKALTLRTESKSGRNFLKAPLAENTKYTRQRMAVNMTTVKGPTMLSAEYYSADYDFTANVKLQGYYLIASYFLTGEQRGVKNGLLDRVPVNQAYDPAGPGIGAWELAVRYSVFYADRKFFEADGLYSGWEPLDPEKNVNAGYTWSYGVNWYPDTMVGIQLDWIQTYVANELARNLSDARTGKSTKSETALLFRIQMAF
jgi:phosphate-selective porin OprO/OprP